MLSWIFAFEPESEDKGDVSLRRCFFDNFFMKMGEGNK